MIIGLTGSKASGKGAIADFLKKDGAVYLSLSDIVREEAKKRIGEKWTIKDLQDIGNSLREEEGNGVLAKRIIEKLKTTGYSVVDGIRNLGEIEALRSLPEFYLIGVDAHKGTRFKRMQERGRESDPKTLEEFLKADERDQGRGEKLSGQQVGVCMDDSDYMIFNDGISIDELYSTFQQQFLNLVKGLTKRRPTHDETWISVAYTVMKRSTCIRRHVGAVIIDKDGDMAATGYNGSAKGLEHCEVKGCIRLKEKIPSGTMLEKCRAVHAEANAVRQADKERAKGGVLYVTVSPCIMCAGQIINAQLKEIVYDGSYPDELSVQTLQEAGIPMRRFTGIRPKAYHQFFK